MGRKSYRWEKLADDSLLDWKIRDLGLTIKGTPIQTCIDRIYRNLENREIEFRPHFWLSEEFFSPEGIPGVGIPFYLAHPRLKQLERRQMFEVEGGTIDWCLKLLRHEVGHAIEHAYRLNYRRDRQKVFGRSSAKYPDYYSPKPYSKSYVIHLDYWYAQSHPDEDFAETFAVWFRKGHPWKKRYKGWPALKKLEFMDALMKELKGKKPIVRTRKVIEPVERINKTLRQYYEEKKERFGTTYPDFYDRDLRRLFSDSPDYKANPKAARFLRSIRPEVRKKISYWTGEYQYTIDQLIYEMIYRCEDLKLRLVHDEETTKNEFLVLLSVQTMNFLHDGYHKLAL